MSKYRNLICSRLFCSARSPVDAVAMFGGHCLQTASNSVRGDIKLAKYLETLFWTILDCLLSVTLSGDIAKKNNLSTPKQFRVVDPSAAD